MSELAILIPARNEQFLARTIQDILEHSEADTEILAGLDGAWAEPPIEDHPRVTLLHVAESIGQRAMTNQLCRLTTARYVMKVDAHCAFEQGFDRKLLALMQDDITMVPVMRNLHAFDWVCPAGHRRYQGPSGPCTECGAATVQDVVWIPKRNPQSTAYRFDETLHFQYWNEFGRVQAGDLTETLSIQGSCFMVTRAKYWALDICSEEFHSWGQQGVEVACKTWLSGGRVLVNRRTWYAHLFRTQGGDFGFPYELPQREVDENRERSRALFQRDGWPGAIYPFQWLIDKFQPPGWVTTPAETGEAKTEAKVEVEAEAAPAVMAVGEPTKGILYYTDNALNMRLARLCRGYIAAAGLPITSVTLKPTDFGRNIVLAEERGYRTLFRQIEAGLAAMTEDVIFFCEHDVLYAPEHFQFTPPDSQTFWYNGHWWQVRLSDGLAVHYDLTPLAGLVAYRAPLLTHFRERNALIEQKNFGYWMGFEPMTHGRVKWQNWYDFEVFQPAAPNVDLAHRGNLTTKRFSTERFIRQPKYWHVADSAHVPGWPQLAELLAPLRAA
jgi:hypothetical protein